MFYIRIILQIKKDVENLGRKYSRFLGGRRINKMILQM
ncbi:hypothetical protein DF16_orf04965 [Bacillus thuringiensis serovar kurstaki str. YBT-1520]|nr:hypothetical protein HD73_1295 [Bacillus thuringiensis serovar kurstaki str. HD73]AIM33380.1 hypothetical protein DF16_orf04965 [Bacillus thuringiensis serovar kurstaki str. YBT-1520]EDZ54523.1 hypothetical protein BCAH1134_1184 [Bacillus cereus AH1134]EEK63283.1 hypothetical protein bcere0005_10160 [Bacillus cereus 172560W]EEM54575.1 hypothetical protein bthur0006_10160 [Bacillus thuringiensis serovar kurstaki str. T03a001]KEH50968.1 hypothetical protein BG09_0158 [Bacillus thuringiensis s